MRKKLSKRFGEMISMVGCSPIFFLLLGGILSPALFTEYIDELILNCTNTNVGAFIKINVAIIVYADDILLLSPVDSHLQILLNIVTYGESISTHQNLI